MTANPAWPEVTTALLDDQEAHNRPNLIVHVFHAKLHSLIKDLKQGVLGAMAAFLYTIEFHTVSLLSSGNYHLS
jgi:hypothetical protein